MQEPPTQNPAPASFIELQSVDSTNNYARQLIHAASLPDRQGMAQHGLGIFAHEQVAGKGQYGKTWNSEKDKNIALTLLLKPSPLLHTQQFQLSAAVALAVHDFYSRYAGEDTKIKWPNDLYWQDRKAGGILIESVMGGGEWEMGKWKWAIIGMGININQSEFDSSLKNPVSLKQITGKNFDPLALAYELYGLVLSRWEELLKNGFDNILAAYNARLYKKDETVKLKKASRIFEAKILRVTAEGRLLVQHSVEEELEHGSVEWVL